MYSALPCLVAKHALQISVSVLSVSFLFSSLIGSLLFGIGAHFDMLSDTPTLFLFSSSSPVNQRPGLSGQCIHQGCFLFLHFPSHFHCLRIVLIYLHSEV